MARHRINPRLVKIHRTYTVEEAARTLKAHKNTVRNWIRRGLPTIDDRRPTLIHGADLRRFLEVRRQRAKQPCPPGHIYCVRCRAPKPPAGGMADYLPMTPTSGNLRGICPDCETLIHRRVALRVIDAIRAELEITFPEAPSRIGRRHTALRLRIVVSQRDADAGFEAGAGHTSARSGAPGMCLKRSLGIP